MSCLTDVACIRRRAAAAGIETLLGNDNFRATGITDYLKNGGTLEKASGPLGVSEPMMPSWVRVASS